MICWQVKVNMMCEGEFSSLLFMSGLDIPHTPDPICRLILYLQTAMMRVTTNEVTV